ncbi:MAG: MerR family transcriptional regulator [Candidatus Dormibacteria bacterium]
MRIGEVAALTGVTPRTLRYYEELGLIAPNSRETATHGRRYSQVEIERVRQIKEMQEFLGIGLCEIRDTLESEDRLAGLRAAYRNTSSRPTQAAVLAEGVRVLERQLAQIRERIERLRSLQAELEGRRSRHLVRLAELSPPEVEAGPTGPRA